MKVRNVLVLIIFIVIIFYSKDVKAMTIVLDPGHGGIDSGAVSTDGKTYERDVNLKIAQFLKKYLEEYDVNVYLTHNGFSKGEMEIYDRAMIARNKNADLFMSLHINSSPSGTARGAEAYVTANKSLPKYNEQTTELGNSVLKNLEKLGIKNRGVSTRLITKDKTDVYSDGTIADYYGVIRYAMRGTKIDYGVVKPSGAVSANVQKGEGVPTLLVEHCFINNSDVEFINTDAKIQKIANADGEALVSHYNLKKKNEKENNNENNSTPSKIEPTVNKINETDKVTIKNLKVTDKTLTRISEKTEKDEFLKNFEVTENLKIELDGLKNNIITTGTKVIVKNKKTNNSVYEYNCVIYGDINKDGKISSSDYVLIKNHIMNEKKIDNSLLQATDVSRDGKISSSDYVLIKNHIMQGTEIKTE